jgi:hypothetical protein
MKDTILVSLGTVFMTVPISIFFFKKKWLNWLNKKESWWKIFELTFLIAIIGIITTFLIHDRKNIYLVLMSIVPFYTVLLYKWLYIMFVKIFKRSPVDTFFNFSHGLFWDRLFDIVAGIATTCLPLFLMTLFGQITDSTKVSFLSSPVIKSNIVLSNTKNTEVINIKNSINDKLLLNNNKLTLPVTKN